MKIKDFQSSRIRKFSSMSTFTSCHTIKHSCDMVSHTENTEIKDFCPSKTGNFESKKFSVSQTQGVQDKRV